MTRKIEELLDQLITEVSKGRTVEDCLREYGVYADELGPLLQLAKQIGGLPKPEPKTDSVTETIKKASAISNAQKRKRFSLQNIFVFRPVLARVLAIVLLICLVGVTTVTLSASSLPGEVLYPVKIFAEQVQYFLTIDAEGKARLHVMFADRRTNEFACLFEPGLPVNRELLAGMLQATEIAINDIELLSSEDATQVIGQMAECNSRQMALLEEVRLKACDDDTRVIDEAIRTCHEQLDCIECMQNPGSGNKSHCPCGVLEQTLNQSF